METPQNYSAAVNKIEQLLLEAQNIAKDELGLDNIFYNERFIELFIAHKLGHIYGNNTQGGDAIEPDTNKPTEYKAINLRNKSKASSFQFHWLGANKLKKYNETDNMYFVVRDGITINEIYKVETNKIIASIEKKSTGTKSINGHWGVNLKNLIEVFNPTKVY
jgi:hypothetical protein